MIKKIFVATILILLSAVLTIFIKEALDTRDPESALPIITITQDGIPLLEQNVYRAGYDWSFFTTVERWQAPSLVPEDLPIIPQEILPGAKFEISFSSTPTEIAIWRATGRYSTDFSVIETQNEGNFIAPLTTGEYLYRVEASWGTRGSIQYFFALSVV